MNINLAVKIFLIILIIFDPVVGYSKTQESDSSVAGCAAPEMMLHVVPNRVSIVEMKLVLDHAKRVGFCTIVISFRSGIELASLVVESSLPVLDRKYLVELKNYSNELGLELIPELPLLTHQEHFLKLLYPNEMYNLTSYDPRSVVVKEIVQNVIKELIQILEPRAVHIGHDEVAGITKYSKKRFMRKHESILPAQLFLLSVRDLHAFLSKQNVETWMWGDMLIEKDEAPGMKSIHFHGHLSGYGSSLRENLPRDITIFDWHYKNKAQVFTSHDVFMQEGFNVVGVSHNIKRSIRNNINYVNTIGAKGFMLTTWEFALDRRL